MRIKPFKRDDALAIQTVASPLAQLFNAYAADSNLNQIHFNNTVASYLQNSRSMLIVIHDGNPKHTEKNIKSIISAIVQDESFNKVGFIRKIREAGSTLREPVNALIQNLNDNIGKTRAENMR